MKLGGHLIPIGRVFVYAGFPKHFESGRAGKLMHESWTSHVFTSQGSNWHTGSYAGRRSSWTAGTKYQLRIDRQRWVRRYLASKIGNWQGMRRDIQKVVFERAKAGRTWASKTPRVKPVVLDRAGEQLNEDSNRIRLKKTSESQLQPAGALPGTECRAAVE